MPWVAPIQTALGLTTKAKAWALVEMLRKRDQCPVEYEDFDPHDGTKAAEEIEALRGELKAAQTKATKAPEKTERCTMRGGAGNIRHQNPSESRASCARSCKSKANKKKSDNYLCTWGSMVLHTYPIRRCLIKGGAGNKKVDEPLTRYKCNVNCYKTFKHSKFCKFGNEITKCKAINKIKCPRGPGTGHRL